MKVLEETSQAGFSEQNSNEGLQSLEKACGYLGGVSRARGNAPSEQLNSVELDSCEENFSDSTVESHSLRRKQRIYLRIR